MRKESKEPIRMIVVNSWTRDSDLIGLHPVVGRLDRVLRLPGESAKALIHRALAMVRGPGQLVVYPMLRD